MTRALPLVRAQIARVKLFPSRFDEMWNESVTSLSTLQKTDMHIASNLSRLTRANRKTVQRDQLRMEFVTTCNTVVDDMEARFGSPVHDVIAQGLYALTPGSAAFLDPPSLLPFAKLFRVAGNESLLTAQLLTARSMIEHDESPIFSVKELADYFLIYRKAFPLVLECISVAMTIPVSSSSAERSFSTVKRIMTRLRTSMSDERLSDLTTLSTHRLFFFSLCTLSLHSFTFIVMLFSSLAKELNEDDLVSRFLELRPRRFAGGK